MCSSSWQMDNDHGDLSDILRVSSRGGGSIIGGSSATSSGYDWNFPPEPTDVQASCPDHDRMDDLSSIFHSVHDPFFQETDQMVKSVFYPASNPLFLSSTNYPDHIYGDAMMSHEMNPLLSRMIQIGPKTKVRVPDNSSSSSSSVSPGIINPMNEVVKGTNSLDRTDEKSGVQTNSSRNPASKKRKNQIKKVVCVPAPAASSGNRPTGEVVPSDLWAWRKYGQKPIKGSPYPRGYYRCSSSKGCSARKQVERSRNDPNMLVITYTSEHNHPWPTQRNALAGSTRSQLTKAATTEKVSPPPPHTTAKVDEAMSEELIKDNSTANHTHNGHEELIKCEIGMETEVVCVKKEVIGDVNKNLGMYDNDMNQDYHHSYRPFHIENQSDDFFYELDELEPNPLKLLLPNGLDCEKSNDDPPENKGLDSFGLFEWPENSITGSRKGL